MNHHYRNSISVTLPATASLETVQSLSTCGHLTLLELENDLGETSTCTEKSDPGEMNHHYRMVLFTYSCRII